MDFFPQLYALFFSINGNISCFMRAWKCLDFKIEKKLCCKKSDVSSLKKIFKIKIKNELWVNLILTYEKVYFTPYFDKASV